VALLLKIIEGGTKVSDGKKCQCMTWRGGVGHELLNHLRKHTLGSAQELVIKGFKVAGGTSMFWQFNVDLIHSVYRSIDQCGFACWDVLCFACALRALTASSAAVLLPLCLAKI
jgi:hypothetical protein